jgi:hypothetical protein
MKRVKLGIILPSYGTAGSMIPLYLFCLFLCTAAPPAGFSSYIFINTTVTFIGTSGHSVHGTQCLTNQDIVYKLLNQGEYLANLYHKENLDNLSHLIK